MLLIALVIVILVALTMAISHPTQPQDIVKGNGDEKSPTTERGTKQDPLKGEPGLKLKFGDKLVDPKDPKVTNPHHVRPNLHPKFAHGGLQFQDDHRPEK